MGNGEMSAYIEIKGLYKRYKNGSDMILNGLDLSVEKEDFLCIAGPSGCGKTTLLRCIAGFEEFSGRIMVNGGEVKQPSPGRVMVKQV